ncbi:MAG: AMP-binding protein, partial [bacterium]
MTFGKILSKRVALNPGDTAVVFEDRRYTYRELDARTNKLANALKSQGVKKGDRIGALMLNCSEFIDIYFALAKLGAIMVPVNFRLAPPEVAYILGDSGADMLFHGAEQSKAVDAIKGDIKGMKKIVPLGGEFEALLSSGDDGPVGEEVGMDDPQLILYTSGTTGVPKGAVLTHGNSVWNSINGIIDFGIRKEDITLVSAP